MAREDDQTGNAPGPAPEQTPGLEQGGSVPPGETPPEAGSASRAISHEQRATPYRTKWLWLSLIVVLTLLIALFFVTMAVGLVLQ